MDCFHNVREKKLQKHFELLQDLISLNLLWVILLLLHHLYNQRTTMSMESAAKLSLQNMPFKVV